MQGVAWLVAGAIIAVVMRNSGPILRLQGQLFPTPDAEIEVSLLDDQLCWRVDGVVYSVPWSDVRLERFPTMLWAVAANRHVVLPAEAFEDFAAVVDFVSQRTQQPEPAPPEPIAISAPDMSDPFAPPQDENLPAERFMLRNLWFWMVLLLTLAMLAFGQ